MKALFQKTHKPLGMLLLALGLALGCNHAQRVQELDKQPRQELALAAPEHKGEGAAAETAKQACQQLIDQTLPFSDPKLQSVWEAYQAKKPDVLVSLLDLGTKEDYATQDRQLALLLAASLYADFLKEHRESKAEPVQKQKALILSAIAIGVLNEKDELFIREMIAAKSFDEARYRELEQRVERQSLQWLQAAQALEGPLKAAVASYGAELSYSLEDWKNLLQFSQNARQDDKQRSYAAIAQSKLGHYDAAMQNFDAIKSYPSHLRLSALEAKAEAQKESAQLRGALETYRRIYELDPESPQGSLAFEALMAEKERWPSNFSFPRPSKSEKAQSARGKAEAHFNAHRSEKAIAAYLKLLKEDKSRKDTANICADLFAIGRSHVKLRQHAKAVPYFEEGLKLCQKDSSHIKLLYTGARAAWNAGQGDKALQWYQKIIDDFPKHSYADDAYNYQAQIYSGRGDVDKAREKLEAQIAHYPQGDMAKDAYWMLLAELYGKAEWQAAVNFVEKHSANAGEDDIYSQGRLRYFQARAYEQLGQSQKARDNYLQILREQPLSYYAMISLGRIAASDKNAAEAWIAENRQKVYSPTREAEFCFETLPTEDAFVAAKMLIKIGQHELALAEIDTMQQPDRPRHKFEASLARAMILQRQGQYQASARLAASLLSPVQDLEAQNFDAWPLAYPLPWYELVSKASGDDKMLFWISYAIMREESYYNPKAESWANARGLMQLMLPTAQSTAASLGMSKPSAADLFKPEIAIPLGSAYIAKLLRILPRHPMFVLPGYNAGQGNVGKWLERFEKLDVDFYVEQIPFREARHYAKRVSMTIWRYRWLYDPSLFLPYDAAQKVESLKLKP